MTNPTVPDEALEAVGAGGLQQILELARRRLSMELAFLAEFSHGRQVYRGLAGDAAWFGAELHRGLLSPETYCQLMTDGRLPNAIEDTAALPAVRELAVTRDAGIGSYVGVPIRLADAVLAEDRGLCLAAGMDDFVAKPLDVEHLRETLRHWIPDTSAPQASTTAPHPEAPTELGAVSPSRLEVLRGIGPADGWGVLPTVVRAFLDTSSRQLAELQAAADAADQETVRSVAHRLRGAAANLGADWLAAACAGLEADAGSVTTVRLLDSVKDELNTACAELESVLAGKP